MIEEITYLGMPCYYVNINNTAFVFFNKREGNKFKVFSKEGKNYRYQMTSCNLNIAEQFANKF